MLAILWCTSCTAFARPRTVLPSLLVLALTAITPSSALGQQESYCPPEPRSITVGGIISAPHFGNWDNVLDTEEAVTYPCEVYYVTYTVGYMGTQPAQPNFWIGLADSNNVTFATDIVGFSTSAGGQLPTTAEFGAQFYGTLHPSGNVARIKVFTTSGFVPLSWSATIHLTPRPTYNRIGGLTIGEAPLVHDGDTVNVSLRSFACCNFYKVLLKPYGTLSVTGTASNVWQNASARFFVFVYDSSGAYQGWLADTSINPQSSTTLTGLSTYGNPTSQTQAAYLLFVAGGSGGPAHISSASVEVHAQEATLKLFLDVDGNFDPVNPVSDDAQFVPGSLLNGASVALDLAPQAVQVIAAFVDSSGAIIQPPANQSVTFSLEAVSAFEGIAMNVGDPRGDIDPFPDLVLDSGTPVNFGVDKTARMTLNVWDYAARGRVVATVVDTKAQLAIPKDDNGNGIADSGWVTFDQVTVADTFGSDPAEDVDPTPYGEDVIHTEIRGDGLGAVQEYRGFMVGGYHRRTNPELKDLFIYSSHLSGIGDASTLPVVIHLVEGTEISDTTDKFINHRYLSNVGDYPNLRIPDAPPLITRQRALHVIAAGSNPQFPQAVGLTSGGTFGPESVSGAIEIYHDVIRLISPSHNDTSTPDFVDGEKASQTLAHEIGHAIGQIPHWRKDTSNTGPGCSSILPVMTTRDLTVMITCWFQQTTNVNDPKWMNIPHTYDQTDLNRLRIKR